MESSGSLFTVVFPEQGGTKSALGPSVQPPRTKLPVELTIELPVSSPALLDVELT